MKLIITLLIALTALALAPVVFINRNMDRLQDQIDVLHERVQFNNVFRYHDENYILYGFEGLATVKGKYPVYTPVVMKELDLIDATDEHWKEQLQILQDDGIIE